MIVGISAKKLPSVLSVAHGDPIFPQVGPKNGSLEVLAIFFQNYWIPIKVINITNCLAYRYHHGSEFCNRLPVFLKKAQAVSNYRYELTILDSLPVFFLFLSLCYLVIFYSHVFALPIG